jgi:hypothetical protein
MSRGRVIATEAACLYLGRAYHGTISGPNWGWTLGPDAFAETHSSHP